MKKGLHIPHIENEIKCLKSGISMYPKMDL